METSLSAAIQVTARLISRCESGVLPTNCPRQYQEPTASHGDCQFWVSLPQITVWLPAHSRLKLFIPTRSAILLSSCHQSPRTNPVHRRLLPSALCFALSCIYSANILGAPATLCNSDEKVVFSCAVSGGKMVSLCASPDLTKASGYLQYRFGNSASIQLEYPQRQVSPASAFKYFQAYSSKGGTTAVSFSVDAYRYSAFRTTSAFGYNGAGVIVAKAAKRVAHLKCDAATVIAPDNLFYNLSSVGIPQADGDVDYIDAEQP